MNFRHIQAFLALVEEKHFGKAAKRIHVTQSAFSMQIKALEEEIGALLFIRTNRNVELTEVGEIFLKNAPDIYEKIKSALDETKAAAKGENGNVRIGFVGNAVAAGLVTADIHRFKAEHPGVNFRAKEMSYWKQIDEIVNGNIDVSYCPNLDLKIPPGLGLIPIKKFDWVVVIQEDSDLAKKETLKKEDLSGRDFIIYSENSGDDGQLRILKAILEEDVQVSYRLDSTLSVLAMVASGLGIAIVPSTLSSIKLPNISYRAIPDVDNVTEFFFIYRENEKSAIVNAFISDVKSNL
ncbi:Ben and cat operon transcriptional regulator [Serratia marcescens]|uniref:LysR family transcriptional regulator n=1 Tax=Serratia marcescens TaxID=615 RepID=UPI002179A205|nr:LysR family transcriptional regulator [Serratia marcescens]CAI0725500.1 Ben and cat operon transcriptional regulator [Serratia marcescens]CAI0805119.1 Ben and cat operon transcriptional regulator [Serratia marcescens]CAI1676521.1 Ben and cat operon transcriptional regulator [Serratia marcescens]CAI1707542.1 Ben and cat operon transcriptional regulator [Serratia marcescens]